MNIFLRKYRYIISFIVFIVILGIGWVSIHKDVTIFHDSKTTKLWTTAKTVEDVLKEAGISLGDQDKIEPSYSTKVTDELQINVKRAQKYYVYVDNSTKEIFSPQSTVKEILIAGNISLGELDKVEPNLEEKVLPETSIKVTRVEVKEISEKVDIAYTVEKRPDNSLLKGEERVLIKGRDGLEEQKYKVWIENGVQVAKEIISKKIIKEPISKVIAYGTMQSVSRSGNTLNFERVITMEASAYTHTGNRTTTGIWPKVGIVAVDPKVIPLGTRLYIEGYGYATAADTGGYIKGNRVDVFLDTKAEALKFGRKNVKVYVLK